MIINALNSGADSYMADFEDSNTPTWSNQIEGQLNIHDAVRRMIEHVNEAGKRYTLNDTTATLLLRPRGWHLDEKHVRVDGERVSAGLFDFALSFFHNAREQLARGAPCKAARLGTSEFGPRRATPASWTMPNTS